jgi:hypothetical protein
MEIDPHVLRFQAFAFTRYFVSGIKRPASAAEHPISFVHGRLSDALSMEEFDLRR